jgi:CheY-like chemotaxis protein
MVHSRGKGHGATFIVELPVPALHPETPAVSDREGTSKALNGLKVMLVEDEFDTREMVAEGLAQSGAAMLQAASGAEALRVISRQTPDVLISDIGMPDMDGYELMRKIRTECPPGIRTIPAVALTAFATEEDKESCLQAGYQAYLVKPVTIGELVTAIASLARRTSLPK